jgi:small subunit ribosomal protein S20
MIINIHWLATEYTYWRYNKLMPNTRSAKKSMRTSAESHDRNKAARHRVRTAIKKLDNSIEQGSADTRNTAFNELCSVVDKAVKKGAMKANTAARQKSKAAKKVKSTAA